MSKLATTKVLPLDDWQPGMYVTVIKPRKYEVPIAERFGLTEGMMLSAQSAETVTREDRSGMGALFEVIAVSLPVVLLERVGETGFLKGADQWNVNEWCFGRVTDEYAEAYKKAKEAVK